MAFTFCFAEILSNEFWVLTEQWNHFYYTFSGITSNPSKKLQGIKIVNENIMLPRIQLILVILVRIK